MPTPYYEDDEDLNQGFDPPSFRDNRNPTLSQNHDNIADSPPVREDIENRDPNLSIDQDCPRVHFNLNTSSN